MTELKQCKCGGRASDMGYSNGITDVYDDKGNVSKNYMIKCKECGIYLFGINRFHAKQIWNEIMEANRG